MLLMVDWITGTIRPKPDPDDYAIWDDLKERFDTGQVLRIKPGGELDWSTAARLAVPGSYDNQISVRSTDGLSLELSGNPVKFLQGHNLFGSDDALGLFFTAGNHVRQSVGQFPSPDTWAGLQMMGPHFTRLDVTRSYRFPTQAQARSWVRSVASGARSKHGAALYKEGTVYFGQKSRRWSLKIYPKADEIRAKGKMHRLVSFFGQDRSDLEDWAQGVLRFEIQLRSLELQKWPDLTPQALPRLWQHYFNTVTFNRNAQIVHEGLDMADQARMDHAMLGYLARWKTGEDLRGKMKSGQLTEKTFYKWRKRILEACGVDISNPPPSGDVETVDSVALDPAGWDPEPIKTKFYTPDPELPLKYKSH